MSRKPSYILSINISTARALKNLVEIEDPNYYGMKKLKIQGKNLTTIPNELFSLTDLEVLDMSPEREACLYYKLPGLSPNIGRLVNLKVLLLDTNDLRSLPAEIGKLLKLERLSLSNNNLQELPREFSQLVSLKSLHLANNGMEYFPPELLHLQNLKFLDLSSNLIRELPALISKLTKLESLFLFENDLAKLPMDMGELTKLRCLWVGNNSLQSIPKELCTLRYLNWSKTHCVSAAIDGNPLKVPPIDVCKEGIKAMRVYFEARS